MNVDEVTAFLAERGYRFEYDHEAWVPLQASAWRRRWVWRTDDGQLVAWSERGDLTRGN